MIKFVYTKFNYWKKGYLNLLKISAHQLMLTLHIQLSSINLKQKCNSWNENISATATNDKLFENRKNSPNKRQRQTLRRVTDLSVNYSMYKPASI